MFHARSSVRKRLILFSTALILVSNSVLAQDLNPPAENETPNEEFNSKARGSLPEDSQTPDSQVNPVGRALIESLKSVQTKSKHNDDQYGESWRFRTEIYVIEHGYPLTSGEQLLEESAKKGKKRRLLLGGLALVPSVSYYAVAASLTDAHPAHLQVAGALSIGSAVGMLKPSQAEQIEQQYQYKRHVFNKTQSAHSTANEIARHHPQDSAKIYRETVLATRYFRSVIQKSSATLILRDVQWKTFRKQLDRWEEYLNKYPDTAFRPRIEANMRAADRLMAQAYAEKKQRTSNPSTAATEMEMKRSIRQRQQFQITTQKMEDALELSRTSKRIANGSVLVTLAGIGVLGLGINAWEPDLIVAGLIPTAGGILGLVSSEIAGGIGLTRGAKALEEMGADYQSLRIHGYWGAVVGQVIPMVNFVAIPAAPILLNAEHQNQKRTYTDFKKSSGPHHP